MDNGITTDDEINVDYNIVIPNLETMIDLMITCSLVSLTMVASVMLLLTRLKSSSDPLK